VTATDPALFDDVVARGLVHDSTDPAALAARLAEGPVTLYHGIDPTADSLHVGHLIGLVMLRRFAEAGHQPLALAGGATGMVGDPSGRSDERNLLDEETLAANLSGITAQIARIVGSDAGIRLVDNRTWTADLTLIDFLRDVGKHVTVNTMLNRESVRHRLGSDAGISFTEFAYMLVQAHDYRWLADHLDCELQVGDGTKLGKTTSARVWLDPRRTSPYQFFQHWMQTDDTAVGLLLAQFTLLSLTTVAEVVATHGAAPEQRHGQRRLAREVTALVHGEAAAAAAEEASTVLFGAGVDGVSAAGLAAVAGEVPTQAVRPEALAAGLDLADALAVTGLTASKAEARRAIAQGGAYVNDERATASRRIGPDDLRGGRYVVLRRGKRAYAVLDAGAG
jgi:tyrosyl-tRNA synthetase